MRGTALILAAAALSASAAAAAPAPIGDLVRGLGDADPAKVRSALTALGDLGDARALPAVEALYDDRLRAGPDGAIYVYDGTRREARPALGGPAVPAAGLRPVEIDNELRRVVVPLIARLRLQAPDAATRLAAAESLAQRGDAQALPLLRAALAREADPRVKEALSLAVAHQDLASGDPAARLRAAETLAALARPATRGELEAALRTEKDPRVRAAAEAALSSIRRKEALTSGAGHLIYGLSLASVLLFAALGLAITFGVMGVINMAHGEMLTIGAYATYVVQLLCQRHAPALLPYYVLAAIPVAFVASGATGVLLERTIIRRLYGRPLETLLATWGISLALIQTIRLGFGASNVAVANPGWLAGGAEILPGVVVPYARIAVVLFVVGAAALVWVVLQRTRLGLEMRAVTQNRGMAACLGVRTARVDTLTFGLGSAIAGLGGVALSQLGNVGPELGQTYILDSFMVVVLGGVGRIAGTIAAALGMGVVQKLLEPVSGAVLGKIAVLGFLILFIQRRPQGIFPQKGRVEV